MHDEYQAIDDGQEDAGQSRREFLKKAGKVAWVVPTLSIVNMAAASAGDINGSVVTTSPPTSTRPPTTTKPPCRKTVRVKAKFIQEPNGVLRDGNGGMWEWCEQDDGRSCIDRQVDEFADGGDIGIMISPNSNAYEIYVGFRNGSPCEFVAAAGYVSGGDNGRDGACVPGGTNDSSAYVRIRRPAANADDNGGLRFAEFVLVCPCDD